MALVKAESQSHAAVNAAGESPKLHVAVNTAGFTPTRPDQVLSARRGTPELGRRLVDIHHEFERIFGRSSVSVLPGRNVDSERLVHHLAANDVPVSSVDIPDEKSYPAAVRDATVSLLRGQIADAQGHIGWSRLNVGTPEQQAKKTRKALSLTRDPDSPGQTQVVKAHAGFWVQNPRSGEAIDAMLGEYHQQTGNQVALAVEIDEQRQTPGEYLAFLEGLRDQYTRKNIGRVFADMDLGHLQQARSINNGTTPGALDFLSMVLADPRLAETVKIVSLNQYQDGAERQHARPDKGSIDFSVATHLMGESMRQGRLPSDTVALLEPHPADYEWFIGDGLVYWERLNRSFLEGRAATGPAEEIELYKVS